MQWRSGPREGHRTHPGGAGTANLAGQRVQRCARSHHVVHEQNPLTREITVHHERAAQVGPACSTAQALLARGRDDTPGTGRVEMQPANPAEDRRKLLGLVEASLGKSLRVERHGQYTIHPLRCLRDQVIREQSGQRPPKRCPTPILETKQHLAQGPGIGERNPDRVQCRRILLAGGTQTVRRKRLGTGRAGVRVHREIAGAAVADPARGRFQTQCAVAGVEPVLADRASAPPQRSHPIETGFCVVFRHSGIIRLYLTDMQWLTKS